MVDQASLETAPEIDLDASDLGELLWIGTSISVHTGHDIQRCWNNGHRRHDPDTTTDTGGFTGLALP
jgi:hypothetical protein